ncbi:hypothetical protein ACW95P_01600 [Candidatus Mycoplasma pogonae]
MKKLNKNRKKWFFLGGIAVVASVVIIAPLSYFLHKKNTENQQLKITSTNASNFWVEGNNLILSLTQTSSPLKNNQVTIKYWDNANPKNIKEVKSSVNALLKNIKATIPNLEPGKKYSAEVWDSENKLLQKVENFFIYQNPTFKHSATTSELRFKSSKLDPGLKNANVYIAYAEANKEGDTAFKKEKAQIVAGADNSNDFFITATIPNLNSETGYLVSFWIENNQEPLMQEKVFYTAGENNLELSVLEVTKTMAKIRVQAIQKYFNKFGRNKNNVLLKYFSSKTNSEKSLNLTLPENEDQFNVELNDLNSGDLYEVYILDPTSESKNVISSRMDFVTNTEPKLQEIFLAKKGHDFLPLTNQVVVSFTDFVNNYDATNSIDPQTMQAVFWEGDATTKISDAAATVKTFNLPELVFGISNLFVDGLEHNKQYNFNLFKKTDQNYQDPQIETVNFTYNDIKITPQIDKTKITYNNAVITLENFPADYAENELIIYLYKQKADKTYDYTTPISSQLISVIDQETKKAVINFDNLEPLETYRFAVYPNYALTQKKEYDFLADTNVEFTTKGFLTFELGNWYNSAAPTDFLANNEFTFKLEKIDEDFPFGQELVLQWRKKPEDLSMSWEENDSKNSFDFSITNANELVNNAKEFSFDKKTKEFWLGETNEVRLFAKSDSNKTNLIKKGNTEFKFNDTITATVVEITKDEAFINDLKTKFHKPAVKNIVNYDYLGGYQRFEPWQRYRGFNTKKKFIDLYEYLAFKDEVGEDTTTFANNIKNGFKNYMNTTDNQYAASRIWILSPLDISDYPGDDLLARHEKMAEEGSEDPRNPQKIIQFGGISPRSLTGYTPIKPSDFMSARFKFKSWNEVPKGVKFRMERFKKTGISLDNNYLIWDYKKELNQIVPSFFKQNLDYINKVLNLTYPDTFTNTYNLEVKTLEDILPNDLTGELGLKVEATPKNSSDGQKFTFFITLKGLKKAVAGIISQDIEFNLYPDQAIGKYYFTQELNKKTDAEDKKKFVETYFKITKDANVNYKVLGAEIINNNLMLNLEITKIISNWGTEQAPITKEIQINAPLALVDNLPVLSKGFPNGNSSTQNNQGVKMPKSGISNFDNLPTKDGKGYAINLTRPDFLALMQEAVAKDTKYGLGDDAEAKKIADQIINNYEDFPITNLQDLGFLFFSPMGTTPLANVVVRGESSKSVDKNTTQGFYVSVNATEDWTIDDLKNILVGMVKEYGK